MLENPTLLNNEKLCGSVRINNDDKVTIGDKTFVYRLPVTTFKVQSAKKENLTNSARKSLPAILHEIQNNQNDSDISTNSKQKISLLTPLKQAIHSRRKSHISTSSCNSAVISTSVPIAEKPQNKSSSSVSSLATPLKQAILARRKSHFPEPSLDTIQEEKAQDVSVEFKKNALDSAVKNAIHSRRISTSAISKCHPQSLIVANATQTDIFETKKMLLASPLKRAINAKRKSFSIDPSNDVQNIVQETNPSVNVKKTISTPLKKDILSRRKSIQTTTQSVTMNMENAEEKASETIDAIFTMIPPSHQPTMLNTPLRKAIQSRRKSVFPVEASFDKEEEETNIVPDTVEIKSVPTTTSTVENLTDATVKKKLQTPLKQAIQN